MFALLLFKKKLPTHELVPGEFRGHLEKKILRGLTSKTNPQSEENRASAREKEGSY